jgi:thioredoxin reductase (NADPH)
VPASPTAVTDVAIIGAGPVGLELAVALKREQVEYLHFEAGQIGQTIFHWPPHTQFFSSPERIAVAGLPIHSVDQQKITGEAYLAYLRTVTEYFDLQVRTYEKVADIERDGGGFVLHTVRAGRTHAYRARRVVFSSGGMAGPRRLGIPGESLPHVHYVPDDPHRYFRTQLLIVGGRNTAVEAALRNWRAGARVAVSYRRRQFDPEIVKRHLYAEVNGLIETGQIRFFPETTPVEICQEHVVLAATCEGGLVEGQFHRVEADFVLMCTGFVADMGLFERVGVELTGDERMPIYDDKTMETNVPGVFVAGTATAGTQQRFKVFIETSHLHVEKIVAALTGRRPKLIDLADARRYQIAPSELES